MKSISALLILILASSPTWAAALRCSQVLNKVISADQLDAAISDIAQMKLELDLAVARGEKPLELDQLTELFPLKVADLNSQIAMQFTPKQIQEKITQKIRELQDRKNAENKKETEVRKETQSAVKTSYVLKTRLPLKTEVLTDDILEYLPEIGAVIYTQKSQFGTLVRLDLKTGQRKILADKAPNRAVLTPDRKSMIYTDITFAVYKIDLTTGAKTTLIKAKVGQGMHHISVDPTGEIVFASVANTLTTYNLKTRAQQEYAGISADGLLGISPTKVAITSLKHTHSVFDTTTGTMERLGPHDDKFLNVLVIEPGKTVAVQTKSALEFYDIADLSKPTRSFPTGYPNDKEIHFKYQIPGTEMFLGKMLYDVQGADLGIFSRNDLHDPHFTFSEYTFHDGAYFVDQGIKFAPDGRSAAVKVRAIDDITNKVKSFIDIWEIE